MRKSGDSALFPFDSEIERTVRKYRKQAREAARTSANTRPEPREVDLTAFEVYENPMADPPQAGQGAHDERTLREYVLPNVGEVHSAIRKPTIAANNFEIKAGTLQMVQSSQFNGSPTADPQEHITNFVEICSTFKYNNVTEDAVRLILFPFSLRDGAKGWLNSLPANSITTWTDVTTQNMHVKIPS